MLIRAWVLNFFGGAFASHRFASTRRGCAPVVEMGLGVFGVGVSGVQPLSSISIRQSWLLRSLDRPLSKSLTRWWCRLKSMREKIYPAPLFISRKDLDEKSKISSV